MASFGALSALSQRDDMMRHGHSLTNQGYYQLLFDMTGYGFVMAWSTAFYPQLILNYKRKSTTGMSIGFVWGNLLAYTLYLVVTSLGPNFTIQDQLFAAHAVLIAALTLAQVPLYKTNKLTDFPQVSAKTAGIILLR
jgi:uncharacterized protein with PQ loop repeat